MKEEIIKSYLNLQEEYLILYDRYKYIKQKNYKLKLLQYKFPLLIKEYKKLSIINKKNKAINKKLIDSYKNYIKKLHQIKNNYKEIKESLYSYKTIMQLFVSEIRKQKTIAVNQIYYPSDIEIKRFSCNKVLNNFLGKPPILNIEKTLFIDCASFSICDFRCSGNNIKHTIEKRDKGKYINRGINNYILLFDNYNNKITSISYKELRKIYLKILMKKFCNNFDENKFSNLLNYDCELENKKVKDIIEHKKSFYFNKCKNLEAENLSLKRSLMDKEFFQTNLVKEIIRLRKLLNNSYI